MKMTSIVQNFKFFNKLPPQVKKELTRMYDAFSLEPNQLVIISMPQVKSMESNKGFYRYRLGDYRIGFYFAGQVLHLSRILHQKVIYKFFPPR